MKNKLVLPPLKWVGGKRQLLPEIRKYMPKKITNYYEPFMGGGAVLFDIQPTKAVVNDINEELINFYTVVRDNVEELIEELGTHVNEADHFYEVRGLDRDREAFERMSNIERAARVHYLNKTCFNGLFRVNNAGQFNSPFGNYKNPNITNDVTLRAVSNYFEQTGIQFYCGDFEECLEGIKKGSFVYLDPPYDPVSDTSSFTGYARGGFDANEQRRLKELCDRLTDMGVKFMLSNSSTDFIRELYSDYKNIVTVKAKRAINSNADSRGEVDEVLVMNYE